MSSSGQQALQIYAGPRALARLAERGLRPEDIRVVPAAAGGPKGLILGPLDRYLFGDWLARSSQQVHLLGASIGAWRMATACLGRSDADAQANFERLAHDYVHQRYDSLPGKMPKAKDVTRGFAAKLDEFFGGREEIALSHPRYRLHLFTSRGQHLLGREGRWRTPLGYTGAFMANLLHRRSLGRWLDRVVFSAPGEALAVPLHDYRSHRVELTPQNFQPALLASCSIPFWLQAVHDIPGAPRGAYWDGGITDYHLHLDYAAMAGEGLVLYPHFQQQVIPGWLDKALKSRHRASAFLDNVVLLAPSQAWIKTLPLGKLPDRADFQHYGDDVSARATAWLRAIAESQRLRDEFAKACEQSSIQALPL
ncbi:patatin-like phospholipase family protein [Paucibacter sp. Y2R2-4]|uniref:patatin-like phospholipase family protein n=1 Tax=Paucibacter sp. Y2R2-4 TaxID=2893553 RepID=UPI0021E3E30A|nr:patatin-like phospholipase family protein [Paucibacter sp. Y2R2-4]MCV2349563.1 patatin-like phospholipase family protein [Paucibacter sp. Y2R2-4]